MTDFNQPCADGFSVGDGIVKSVTKLKSENFTVTDSHILGITKNLCEGGLQPSTSLYPLTTLYPNSGILILEGINKITSKNVSESGTIGDVIGPFAVVKGLSDNIDFLERINNGIVKYLNDNGSITDLSIYNIGKNISDNVVINDIFTAAFTSYLTDSVGISDGIVKSIIKYLEECGLTPYNTLYPSESLYPNSGVKIRDIYSGNSTINLSDEFSIIDTIARVIIKDIPDNINISDNILFNTVLYFEENPAILDEISKGSYKALTDQVDLVDNITKNIISILPETININDDIETILRTLVRATLEAIDDGTTTLSAIRDRVTYLSLA